MSPFSATLRRAAPSIHKASHYAATSSGKVPPEKLRALISLYHQADNFITEENLVDRINEALTKPKNVAGAPTRFMQRNLKALQDELALRRRAPATGTPDATLVTRNGGSWSESRGARERAVVGALYGLDENAAASAALPGLEMLRDARSSLKKDAEDDA